MKKEKRKFCVECCEILLKGEDTKHEGHEIKEKMTNDALDRPTELLPALQNPKANAVSDKMVQAISIYHAVDANQF